MTRYATTSEKFVDVLYHEMDMDQMHRCLTESGKYARIRRKDGRSFRMYYRRVGDPSGPKIIFIMGLGTSHIAWVSQEQFFAKQGYDVLLFDNAGIGRSEHPGGVFTTALLGMDAKMLVDQVGWHDCPVHVVGTSLGGMIAEHLALLLLDEDRLGSLTLAATHAGGLHAVPPLHGIKMVIKGLFQPPEVKINENVLPTLFSAAYLDAVRDSETGMTNREFMSAWLRKRDSVTPRPPVSAFLAQALASVTHFVAEDDLARIRRKRIPVLVCTGTYDHLVRPTNSYLMHGVLRGQLHIWDDVGHALYAEAAPVFNQVVHRMIQEANKPCGKSGA